MTTNKLLRKLWLETLPMTLEWIVFKVINKMPEKTNLLVSPAVFLYCYFTGIMEHSTYTYKVTCMN